MSESYTLTEKANFPENDAVASLDLAIAVGVLMDFVDNFVKAANDDPEVLNLWEIARGFQAASEMYFVGKAKE
jgi:hypothetical protein